MPRHIQKESRLENLGKLSSFFALLGLLVINTPSFAQTGSVLECQERNGRKFFGQFCPAGSTQLRSVKTYAPATPNNQAAQRRYWQYQDAAFNKRHEARMQREANERIAQQQEYARLEALKAPPRPETNNRVIIRRIHPNSPWAFKPHAGRR